MEFRYLLRDFALLCLLIISLLLIHRAKRLIKRLKDVETKRKERKEI